MIHPGLHAIVLNYRQLDEPLACVAALREAGRPGDRILVVDNEEEDLASRLHYRGLEIGLACEATILHERTYRLDEDENQRRAAEQRTSRFLFTLKDPFHSVAYNVCRTVGTVVSYLGHALTSREATVRGWWEEIVWFGRRARPALAHRRREMRGRAHLELPGTNASEEEPIP